MLAKTIWLSGQRPFSFLLVGYVWVVGGYAAATLEIKRQPVYPQISQISQIDADFRF
jgi:hypothetical protein